jgi:adenosine deaminase
MIDRGLPLCELHRHLDGAIRVSTIVDLASRHGISLPADTEEGMRPFVHINGNEPGLMAFIARFHYLTEVLVDPQACYRVAYENVEDARNEGIDYVELRFSPAFMAQRHGLDPRAVVEACADGVQAAQQATGVRVNLVGILSRTYGTQACAAELQAILDCPGAVVAVDLAGDEAGFPASLFAEHFRKVRDAGLHVTVHAGEADGPASVWSALRDLGAERIGHGFRSLEDPALVDFLRESGIGLESCPTSNLHISAVRDYASHPIKALADAGVRFCLKTDDPGISNITLGHEYDISAPATGLTPSQIRQSQINGLQMAFLGADERELLSRMARQRVTA